MEHGLQTKLPSFKYTHLRDGCIRVLSLIGIGSGGIPLCSMVDSALDEQLHFYALSYVWMADAKTRTIVCNNQELQVTESVFEALVGLKSKILDSDLPIWIDSLCINQADGLEKAAQIGNMHKIYRQSKAVIVWLGVEGDNSNLAMAAIDDFAEAFRSLAEVPLPDRLSDYGLPTKMDPIWPALGCLFTRPWFFRLWTFQEIVLAATPVVHCGDAVVNWPEFEMLAYKIHKSRLWPLAMSEKTRHLQFRGFTSVANIAIMRRNFDFYGLSEPEHGPYLPFSRLLPHAQTKQCRELRDRVYAMLSLTSQKFRDMVKVHYQIPLTELYIQCGKACLEQDPDLYYLQLVGVQKRKSDLPSWCLALEMQELEMFFGPHLRAGLREPSAESNRAKVELVPDSSDIKLQGFRAGVIDRVLPFDFTRSHHTSPENARNYVEWEKKARLLACETSGLPQDEIPIAHVCTLSASLKPQPAEIETLTQAYRDQMTHLASQASGNGNCPPPPERMAAFESFWLEMVQVCPGRTYFSTIDGRVGIGSPYIRKGDQLVVIYGTKPVFVLRDLPAPDTRKEIVGNAFVHGLMDLTKTPAEFIRPTEWFIIS